MTKEEEKRFLRWLAAIIKSQGGSIKLDDHLLEAAQPKRQRIVSTHYWGQGFTTYTLVEEREDA